MKQQRKAQPVHKGDVVNLDIYLHNQAAVREITPLDALRMFRHVAFDRLEDPTLGAIAEHQLRVADHVQAKWEADTVTDATIICITAARGQKS